jgi:hypothetical protein
MKVEIKMGSKKKMNSKELKRINERQEICREK